jgi:hypothetical protein
MYGNLKGSTVVPRIKRGGGLSYELFRVADVGGGTAMGDAVRREAGAIGLTPLSAQTEEHPLDRAVKYVGGSWRRYLAFAVRELPGRHGKDQLSWVSRGKEEEMNTVLAIVLASAVGLAALLGVGWLGLQIPPQSFPAYPEQTPALDTVELPTDLPAPVARYYKTVIGDQIPVIASAVITGRGRLRVKGITFPARFRFTHVAGQGYRHYIEATVFGYSVMKVNEWYLDGKARMELPVGVIENEPKIDVAANLGLWGESVWLPSILITDPRVRWEAIDDTTARLVIPFGEEEDTFTVAFDPQTGLIRTMEALRYREATDEVKIPWRNEPLGWQAFCGVKIPSPAATTWLDEGTPWAVWTIEDVTYNVDVSEYVRARGY